MSSPPSSLRGNVATSAQQAWHGGAGVSAFNAKKVLCIAADFFDRSGEPSRPVELAIFRGRLLIRDGSTARTVPLDSVRFSNRSGKRESEAVLPDGGTCIIPDGVTLAKMIEQERTPDKAAHNKYQRLSIILLSAVLAVLLMQSVGQIAPHYFANELASRIPDSWVGASSVRLLAELDHSSLQASELPEETRNRLQDQFASLQPPAEGAPPYRLLFRKSAEQGATSVALPNGDIILINDFATGEDRTDLRLLAMLRSLGHLHYRHALANIAENRFASLLFALLINDKEHGVRILDQGLRSARYTPAQSSEAEAYASRMLHANIEAQPAHKPIREISPAAMQKAPAEWKQALNDDRVIPAQTPPASRP